MKSEYITNKMMPGLIKQRRKEMNISQVEMAEKLNITRESYNKWENSIDFTMTKKLMEVCKILKMYRFMRYLPQHEEYEENAVKLYIQAYQEGITDYQNTLGSENYLYDYIEEMHSDIAALEIALIQNLIKSGSRIRVVNKDNRSCPDFSHIAIWKPEDYEVELKVRNEKNTHYLTFKQFDDKMYAYAMQCSRFAEYTVKDLTASLKKYNK